MGGGDLNLKKSWHPSTLRNIERVWKAEQKHEAEQQKIEQLQKELEAERAREEIQNYAEDQGVVKKKEEKLDWMYQGPAAMVNRDDYLLGRKIDKTFETLQKIESGKAAEEEDNDVGSSMFSSQNLSGTATVDLATKIREDPLFNIMKKEKEQKKNLLSNPVKMKQLQQMLQASLKDKSKKSKKSKKKKHQHDDSDDEVVQKRKKHKKHKSSDSEPESVSRDSRKFSKSKYNGNSTDYQSSKYENEDMNRQYSSSHRRESNHRSHNNSHKQDHPQINHRNDDKRSKSRSEYSSSQQSHHKDPDRYQRDSDRYQRDDDRYQRDNDIQKSRNHYNSSNHRDSSTSAPKKKLDDKERERLLREMQENAKWREDQRKKNATRYREEEEREVKVKKIDSSDFMKPMLAKSYVKGSVESRVKQKIFTIQRSSAAMDKNFARRD